MRPRVPSCAHARPARLARTLRRRSARRTGRGNGQGFGRRFGRYRSAAVRSALLVERVLRDGQVVCAIEGCDRTAVHWDHIVALADDGVTEITNLQPLCAAHHREKTVRENRERRTNRAREKRRGPHRQREHQRETSGPDPPQ